MAVATGAVLGLGVNVLVGPRHFVAAAGVSVSATQGTELPSALTSLAATAGLRLGGTQLPLAFQTDIIASTPFQDSMLLASLPTGLACQHATACSFLDRLVPPSSDAARRLARGRRLLNREWDVERDERSRVITIRYQNSDSVLARALVGTAVTLLDAVNKTLTAQTADAKVAFLSSQVPFLQRQLQQIQDSLEAFYVSNRSFENSPALRFREQRLRGQFDSQLHLLETVREQLATSELQTRGGVQVIQLVVPVSVDPRPSRPLRNLALLLGVVLISLARLRMWAARRTV
ncbi:MAG TPA: hypothetical protein VKB45_14735 [Gemmatimonadales bacterium]|nr:hypothetical protein [Gemmatimonadales bacterium]